MVRNKVLPHVPTVQLFEMLTTEHFQNWRLLKLENSVDSSVVSGLYTLDEISGVKLSLIFSRMRWMLRKYIVFPMQHNVEPYWTLGLLVNFTWIADVHARGHPERHLHFRWIHYHIGCSSQNISAAKTGEEYSAFLTDEAVENVLQVHVPGVKCSDDMPQDSALFLAHYLKVWLYDYKGSFTYLQKNFMHNVSGF
jgi:hypothetical protein